MAKNKNLNAAAKARKDEFYTRIEDIEQELRHYRRHFAGKTVLCNCDDPYKSDFFKYFAIYFNALGLKKLIATCYAGSPVAQTESNSFGTQNYNPLFDKRKQAIRLDVTEVTDLNGNDATDRADVKILLENNRNGITCLDGDGDFRSPECVAALREADIVVTNPPFSLFREYVRQLVDADKKFLIIGNINCITYKEIFPLIKDDKLWLGYGFKHDPHFKTPDDYEERSTRFWIDKRGQKWRSFGNLHWFTNLDIRKRHEDIILFKRYRDEPELFPRYDNCDAIEVPKTAFIPCDYFGVMGVPITFLDKHNPDQFEIVGKIDTGKIDDYNIANPIINGKEIYKRIAIRRRANGD